MEYGQYSKSLVDNRDNKQHQLEAEAKRELEKEIVSTDASQAISNKPQAKTRVLRASDVLLSLAGRSTVGMLITHAPLHPCLCIYINRHDQLVPDGQLIHPLASHPTDTQEIPSPGVENFQEALRIFPPFRDDDGVTLGAVEVHCPDCEAVFSSSNELKQHYLTRFCSGAAVVVYIMTRDRLITKGYRVEKRLVPFDSRPVRFFCNSCEQQFAFGHEGETGERHGTLVDCSHCGSQCNISYEPDLNSQPKHTGLRDSQRDLALLHSRSPSLVQKSSVTPKLATAEGIGEQSLAKRARRMRDSWSLRKLSQSDDDELIAISFSGLYDLERVHAPNGIYQQLPSGTTPNIELSSVSPRSSTPTEFPVIDPGASDKALCEDEEYHRNISVGNEREAHTISRNQETPSRLSKRQSFLQKIFGKKAPNGGQPTSNPGKRLLKRANTMRFSFVTKNSRSDSRATAREGEGTSEEALTHESPEQSQNDSSATIQDAGYVALLQETQNMYVHLQYLPGGTIVHDASGRERILSMEEAAKLFLQLRDEVSAATLWSRIITTRTRAESALNQGNSRGAVVEFHAAMRLLDDTPALDIDKQSRAAILHSLGQAYHNLDMPAESEACYLESLGLYKRSLGRDHPKNFAVLHDLGTLCERDGYATEAAALYERSFAGRLKTLGTNAPETLSSMQELASLKVLLGDLESALLLLEKAVPALDTVFGMQNATTLNAMSKLSLLYQKLGMKKESRTICAKTIPHCRTFFGINSSATRDVVMRYLHCSDNFDFPAEIKDILDNYQRSREAESLRVIHQLGRSYLDAGLNRDAANLFESLVEDFLAVKGPEASETFDALSALCVSRENLDSVDKAIHAYKQLVRMAGRTLEDHHSRKRIPYAERRISYLNRRRELLASERKEWGLNDPKRCENCAASTASLCNTCKIFRFCSESCHKSGSANHHPFCIPSVSPRELKSLMVNPKCPSPAVDQALSKIVRSGSNKTVNVLASYKFYLDPRNFTTFRMKLNPDINTIILFSLDSDIRYTTISNRSSSFPPSSSSSKHAKTVSKSSSSSSASSSQSASKHDQKLTWLTPERQEAISYIPSSPSPPPPSSPSQSLSETPQKEECYVLVTPGKEMLRSQIEKRISVRGGGGQREYFRKLDLPDGELIEYVQGLHVSGYLGETFMYVVEWMWK